MALCVVIGIMIGTFYANHFSGNRLNIINSGSNRLNNLLHIIDDQYVDTVNINNLIKVLICIASCSLFKALVVEIIKLIEVFSYCW